MFLQTVLRKFEDRITYMTYSDLYCFLINFVYMSNFREYMLDREIEKKKSRKLIKTLSHGRISFL